MTLKHKITIEQSFNNYISEYIFLIFNRIQHLLKRCQTVVKKCKYKSKVCSVLNKNENKWPH